MELQDHGKSWANIMTLLNKISNIFKRKEETFDIVDTDIRILKNEFNSSNYIEEGSISEFPTFSLFANLVSGRPTSTVLSQRESFAISTASSFISTP